MIQLSQPESGCVFFEGAHFSLVLKHEKPKATGFFCFQALLDILLPCSLDAQDRHNLAGSQKSWEGP